MLTANLATLLDLYGVEKGLDHYRSTPTLSFQHFRFYLTQEVFSATTSLAAGPAVTLSQLRDYEEKIDEVSGGNLIIILLAQLNFPSRSAGWSAASAT